MNHAMANRMNISDALNLFRPFAGACPPLNEFHGGTCIPQSGS
jgi:hypothetical protein